MIALVIEQDFSANIQHFYRHTSTAMFSITADIRSNASCRIGKPHYRLPETKENVIRGGGEHTIFTLFDAQHDLKNGKLIKRKWSLKKIIREVEIFPLTNKRSQLLGKLFFYIFNPKKGYAAFRKTINY